MRRFARGSLISRANQSNRYWFRVAEGATRGLNTPEKLPLELQRARRRKIECRVRLRLAANAE
jgi:hypothetical protein